MPRPTRIVLLHLALVLFALAIVARAAQVQLLQRDVWAARAQRQHYVAADVPAPRGTIYDEAGIPLARSRQVVRLSVAPRELKDVRAAARALARLGVGRDWVARAVDRSRAWVDLPGAFLPGDAAGVAALRGVYGTPVVDRVYTPREATRRVVGSIGRDGAGLDGIELALDSLLRGRAGRTQIARDSRGGQPRGAADTAVDARPGSAVTLTINQELQEIAESALEDAMREMGADGGDIVVLDPASGEIRAMASKRAGAPASGMPAITEPYEPGSTMKPLIASRLLLLRRARPDERMNVEHGRWTIEGRTITDDHPADVLTLADVITYSSNIGIVKFASRLTPREEFEALRDFGFGTPTGIALPAEASGMLRPPSRWSKQSRASLAMGYEVSVTPLQLAVAYAAIANGGELLEPALVREIRSPDGRVIYQHERRVVRRVMSDSVAAAVRRMLLGVVQEGTGRQAGLGRLTLGGKSGTARRNVDGRYVGGAYTASFVGLFPADKPQFVILVKLDDPQGKYYAAETAAPITRAVIQAAVAARDVALDRGALAASESLDKRMDTVQSAGVLAAAPMDTAPAGGEPDDSAAARGAAPYVFTVPATPARHAATARATTVPDVRGLPLRAAVRALHRAGLRVQLAGFGDAASTDPAPGATVRAGSVVRVVSAP